MNEISYDLGAARRAFSRIGLAFCAILVISTVLQVLWFAVPTAIWGEDNWLLSSSWGVWLGTFIPVYLFAIPAGLLILGKLPAQTPRENKLGTKNFLVFLMICFCMMYGGNLIGTVLALLLSGGTAQNAVLDYAMDTSPLKILFMVILAPLLEEYVCRKQLIDRTAKYGEKTAVLLSAVTFALLHQNLFQFFYAFGLGLVFAYIYTRTGRLRYSVLLHSIINFMGSVVAPWVLSLVDLEAMANMDVNATSEEVMALLGDTLPGFVLYMLYALALIGLAVTGLVLLILKCRKLVWKEAEAQLPKGTSAKTVYLNAGMVLYLLLCLVAIIYSLL